MTQLKYTLGKETVTEKYYLSFLVSPATKRYVEYEEYYEISLKQINDFLNDEQILLEFIEDCRKGKNTDLLTFYPK